MATNLPLITTPSYELTLPSNGKKIKFRPFLVKEEKILLIAVESKEEKNMLSALRQIIVNCVETEDFDVDESPLFDLEYIFLKLRTKSVSEPAKPVIQPAGCTIDVTLEVDLETVEVVKDKTHSNKIVLVEKSKDSPEVGCLMNYPSLSNTDSVSQEQADDPEVAFNVISNCLNHVYQGEEIFSAKDYTADQLTEFIDSLTQDQFAKITSFFETMPHLEKKVTYLNPCTKEEETVTLRGLQDFFKSPSATTP
jgi:hypothetical protein